MLDTFSRPSDSFDSCMLVPQRRRGREILDDPSFDAQTRVRSISDVSRSNVWFGGRRAAVRAVREAVGATSPVTVLDAGTGLADIAEAIGTRISAVTTIGLDESVDLLSAARGRVHSAVCGSVRALPFRDASVDVVLCSQLLHHFADADIGDVIRELNRVARLRVVIADLRRSWVAAAGFWLASFPLGFHPVTRHDGVLSVFRGFTADELTRAVGAAVGVTPQVDRRAGFRLVASWSPLHAQ